MSDTSGRLLIYSTIGFFVGLGFIYNGMKRYLLVQKIRETPTSKIDATPVGLAEISGTANCHDPTKSPVSKVDCAYWRIMGEYYQPGKYGGWRNIYNADSRKQFYVEDDTGKMLVEPIGAEIDIPIDNTYSGRFGSIDDRAMEFIENLDQYGKQAFYSHSGYELRIHEHYIADGDPLFVLGSAEPIDGSSSAVNYENLILKKGDIDNTMYVCDNGERAVIARLSSWMYWHIFGGLALSAVCLFIVLSLLGI